MKTILLLLSLISCFCTPTERTKDQLSCAAHELLKKDCGFYGIDQKKCEEKGCCWKESSVKGVPWCFYGIDDVPTFKTLLSYKSCYLDKDLRKECGYKGIDKAECESRDCCWKIDDYESIIPWCYHGYIDSQEEDKKNKIGFDFGE